MTLTAITSDDYELITGDRKRHIPVGNQLGTQPPIAESVELGDGRFASRFNVAWARASHIPDYKQAGISREKPCGLWTS